MNRNVNMNLSGNTDEYSVLEFHTPKIEYTRSQLIDLGDAANSQKLNVNVNATKLLEHKIVSKSSANIDDLIGKRATEETVGKNLNDEFWSLATTNNQAVHPDSVTQETSESDYHATLAKAALDNRFVLPFNAKVDRWLNSGQNTSDYAHATCQAACLSSSLVVNNPSTFNANEASSTVSNRSAIRAKLLDKTARVKQNLRNLANNN